MTLGDKDTDIEGASANIDDLTANQSLTDPTGRQVTGKIPLQSDEEVDIGAGDSIQSAIDAVANADARRSGTVKVMKDPDSGDFLGDVSSNDSLPITVKNGVLLDLRGVWLRETSATPNAVFDLKPNAVVLGHGAMLSASVDVGSWFRFNGDLESIASQDDTAVLGYPRCETTTTGTSIVEFSQTTGNSVVGGYAEVHAWNSDTVARFLSSGSGGYVNMNRVSVRGNVSTGNAFVWDYDDGTEVTLNVVDALGVNFLSNVDRVAYFDNSDSTTKGLRANVLRGSLFDVANATTPWEWTANCDDNNKVIRRWPSVASGTNNSGDATNEAVADMTL